MSTEIKVDIEKTVPVDWSSEKEHWNEYKLKDGTTLKVKLILKGVRRASEYNPDGSPIYMLQSMNVVRVLNVPKKLRKKPKTQSNSTVV